MFPAAGNTSGGHLRLARRLPRLGRLAAVDVPGQAVDQPYIIFERAFDADETRPHRRNQRGEQNSRGNDGSAKQHG